MTSFNQSEDLNVTRLIAASLQTAEEAYRLSDEVGRFTIEGDIYEHCALAILIREARINANACKTAREAWSLYDSPGSDLVKTIYESRAQELDQAESYKKSFLCKDAKEALALHQSARPESYAKIIYGQRYEELASFENLQIRNSDLQRRISHLVYMKSEV